MQLSRVVETSRQVAATRARSTKTALLAATLGETPPEELPLVVSWLAGVLPQRRTGLGWRGLRTMPPPASGATLSVAEVDRALDHLAGLAGTGSAAARAEAAATLLSRATAEEQQWLRGLLTGEVRQGALDAVVQDAVALAAGVPPAVLRRAAMLAGSTAAVARTAFEGGAGALEAVPLRVCRPVAPMLAASGSQVADAVAKVGGPPVAVEWKLDGIRVQAHRDGDRVLVVTRTLEDITSRLPEVVEVVRSLPARSCVLDGEVIALADDGRPRPFQETAARTASGSGVAVTPYFFDLLLVDDEDLLDRPAGERADRLAALVPARHRVPREVVADDDAAARVLADALDAGHEGVIVKSLHAPYAAGRRGAGWVKVKPVHTIDLVVLAVEEGSGRRRGWLSNIHLGARDPETGELVMVGKTFKGMTDAMLRWQTERFTGLATHRDDRVVHVRPEQVVEIAFDGVQRSRRYPGGLALRFARVVRYRDDKTAGEADTLDTLRSTGGWTGR